ncbi:NAD(P)/FAD-dependent oxidoreductase [Sulfuricystis multivorans]|uniref:NAD(P)/FAD-dependent oxidoreductase n=1 Tax=Sulfuricystis multivorans TaxID=2211108 RepID=UPI000F83E7E3|nr:FAD-dependent oxidoreductase [Sulfuricystis multivorans]
MRHVIIGNGPAGVVAAETLRRLQPTAEIALIGDEAEPPYSRMAIPYFLQGNIPEDGTHLRKTHDHFTTHRIHLIQGRVSCVDSAVRQIEFASGERLAYDRLLIATGSRPIRPEIPGIDLANVHTCWTLDDARAIAAKAQPGSRVVQLGAGFIGCIILEALATRDVELTIVEMGDRMVPRMMTLIAGAMIERWVKSKGIEVRVSTAISAIEQDGDALCVKLGAGETALRADLVICAAGVRPNVDFLAGSGVALGRGIRVDRGMRTSVPDIYAAGDVTEAPGFYDGTPQLNAIQPNAVEQGRIAAINMAGGNAELPGSLAINVLDTLGLISTSFGHWQGKGDGVELVDEANFRYLSLQFEDDVLIGATSIGWTDHVGALRGLIQSRIRLGPWKARLMADPTQFMAAYLACTQKAA